MAVPKKDLLFVTVQFLLMIIYLYPLNLAYFQPLKGIGLGLFVLGAGVGLQAIWELRHSISPFPSPKASATLIQEGIFKWVRHPIYTGILSVFFGYAIASGSLWRILLTLVLAVLFQFKARYEEQLLLTRFQDYKEYKSKTGRFLPRIRL